jgi:hypothetical protein
MADALAERRLPRRIEPRVEECVEVLSGHALGQPDELRCGDIAVGVLLRPLAEDDEEVVRSYLLPQHLQRHGAPQIALRTEKLRWIIEVCWWW